MKKLVVLVLAVFAIASTSGPALAQTSGKPAPQKNAPAKAPNFIDMQFAVHNRVVATLGLTAAQKKSVAAADQKYKAVLQKMFSQDLNKLSEAQRKKMGEDMQKSTSTYQAELKKAMGPKFATYEKKLQVEMQKEAAKMASASMARSNQMIAAINKRVIAGLGLTAAQKNALAAADKKFEKDSAPFTKKMMDGSAAKMTQAQQKKFNEDFMKVNNAKVSAYKKAMGEKKYAEYEKRFNAELQKEIQKMMPAAPKPAAKKG